MTTATATTGTAEASRRRPRPQKVEDVTTLTLPPVALRVLSALLECAQNDDKRPLLTCVELTVKKGHVEAAATDSYRLAVARFHAPESADGTLIVPRVLVRNALKFMTAKALARAEASVVINRTESAISLAIPGVTFTAELPEATPYPDWRSVVPRGQCELDDQMAFNALFLASLGRVARALNLGWPNTVKPYFYGRNRPSRFAMKTVESGVEFTYVLMPVRAS